ncbi:MAG TPA: D-alanyl-D-alanine carboxypeptidase family protein [Gaiellaceae bacterium]|nr:D-alanyl-D-alanine carboxypeptidase family protein [Gaiellaceae bacterium]
MSLKTAVLVAAAALVLVSTAVAAVPHVGGRAYLVVSASGDTLLQKNADERVPIASITKLMTVLVTLERTKLDDVVTVERQAVATGGESIFLEAGERFTVRELIEGALIQSANDAAVALAQYVGHGSVPAFVALMNAKARQLGLTETHFENPDGLDAAGHYSSARDVTKLAQILMHIPFVRSVVRLRVAHITGNTLHTWNDLLGVFPGVIGVKTGHTSKAGWSEVAAAQGRGVTIYATLIGEPNRAVRNRDLAQLLAFGLSQYRVVPVVSAGKVYATAEVPWGKKPLGLVAARDFMRVARVGRLLTQRVVTPMVVSLPVRAGERLGTVKVFDRGKLVAQEPLVADRSISRPGLLGRVGWYAGRTFHHIWSWL